MLKVLLPIICIITCCMLKAQQPVSFYNYHVYGEKEGVIHNDLSGLFILDDGSLAATAYTNGQYTIGSTGGRLLKHTENVDLSDARFYIVGGDSFLLKGTSPTVIIYKNGHLITVKNSPQETQGSIYLPGYGIIYTAKRKNQRQLEKFDGKKFTPFGPTGVNSIIINKNGNGYIAAAVNHSSLLIYVVDTATLHCALYNAYPLLPEQQGKQLTTAYMLHDTMFVSFEHSRYIISKKSNSKIFEKFSNASIWNNGFAYFDGKSPSGIVMFTGREMKALKLPVAERIMSFVNDSVYNSTYVSSYNKVYRFFNHIKQYPTVFYNSNSSTIFSIQQSGDGAIWVGGYNGLVSRIYKDKIETITSWNYPVLNGGLGHKAGVFLISEGGKEGDKAAGIYYLQQGKAPKQLVKGVRGYYLYRSSITNRIYYGTSAHAGLFISDSNNFFSGLSKWKIIDSTKGMGLMNILTITEDGHGRIWLGRGPQGISIYYPKEDKAETFLLDKKQINFGAMSSLTDSYGTVWLGSKNGLWYHPDNTNHHIKPVDIKKLHHPLLVEGNYIWSMKQWGDWLVMGATDKMVLLNLKIWHASGEIILRYLNPHEASFSTATEQNTILIDNRDSNIWFSTSDMLYQWDIRNWLSLPTYHVHPVTELNINQRKLQLNENSSVEIKPTENTLEVSVLFQTKDNMPRYISVALSKKGDSVIFPPPSLQTNFHYPNLSPGTYKLVLYVFEQDGTTSTHYYPVVINAFLWQRWWFWTLIAVTVIGIAIYLINVERKRQVAEERSGRISAEAEALRSEQNRQLTKMQVVSLSNQFRPHFILNALNTVGAQLYDKPEVDSVLGQLGDSIGIIFKNAQAGKIAHPLSEEWKLVESVINIKQLEFRNEVEIILSSSCSIIKISQVQVPLGILQIPVENALVHGLRNKESGSRELWIDAIDDPSFVEVTITDNGIGRKAAAGISNYRKHGVGTKNMAEIIELLNRHNKEQIRFCFEDEIFNDDAVKYGTRVIINIPKNFNYEIA